MVNIYPMKLSNCSEIDVFRAIALGAITFYQSAITISGYQSFKGQFIGVNKF